MSGHPSSKHLPPQSSEMGNNLKLYDTDLYQQDKMHFNVNAIQWYLSMADMLYSGHLSIADTVFRNQLHICY